MSIVQFVKSKLFFKQILIAFVGLIVFVFVIKVVLRFSTNHNQKIEVPNLSKLSIEEAALKLNDLDLDYIVIDSASYNPEYPKFSVIEQNPEAGEFVKEKRKIYLTLNPSRYRDVTIPNLNGRTKRQAISELRAIGFKVSQDFIYINDIGKDVVRGMRHNGKILNPNEKLQKNSEITLVLGDGGMGQNSAQTDSINDDVDF
ncbi:PASTA domain-containing protein [Polaribacter gangjinensis]|uniref:Serine/threonine protein kinase n=1 Tax=Polaribacter gangjinensis TaxID=574710 RepID=A0A2S7W9E5_9FLAO|nr:PASTA domain-containing protein [Polaribacter gangjinensis]PQJ73842.1 serine/threonine protein kinase [Polaribacter gangjinensis]